MQAMLLVHEPITPEKGNATHFDWKRWCHVYEALIEPVKIKKRLKTRTLVIT